MHFIFLNCFRGCDTPPSKTSEIYSSYNSDDISNDLDVPVGTMVYYRCKKGVFDLYRNRSKFVDFIDMTCINHPDGITRAVWDPYFHHVYAGFPPCVTFSKFYFFYYYFFLHY